MDNIKSFSYKGAIAICAAAMMWGIDGVLLTPNLYNLNAPFVVLMVHLIPFLFMMLILRKEFRHLKTFTKPQLTILLLIALFGGCIGTQSIVRALFLVNFKHLTIVVMIQKLQPVFAIFLATLFLKEKMSKNFILWASVAITAGYFMTFGFALPDFNSGDQTFAASLYALLAAFSFGSATVLGKKAMSWFDFKTTTFYRYMFTSIIMIIWVAIAGQYTDFAKITPLNWTIFILISITTGSGAVLLFYYGLKRVKAIVSTICELMFPITALVLDYLIHGTVLTWIQVISMSVMLFSIIMINMKK